MSGTDAPHPDADLLALAAEHSELVATMARLGWSDGSGQDHEWQGAMERCSDLERAIIDTPATTFEGKRVKARIFYGMMDERPEECTDLDPGSMLFSLIRDLLGEEDFTEAGKERDRRIACDRAMDEKSKESLQ